MLLARWICGEVAETPVLGDQAIAFLLGMARQEGVISLVDRGLQQQGDTVLPYLHEVFRDATRRIVGSALLRDAECRRALATLPADMPVLVLKGSALAYWLYPQPFLRECSDIDLLLPTRAHAEQAAERLGALGYAMHHQPDDLAHELLCRRTLGNGMQIDLDVHWRLANAPVFAELFSFDELLAASMALPALGPNARGLEPVHAYLHACLHRALNVYTGIGDRLKWLYDLHLLAAHFQPGDWRALQVICEERRISGVCAEGIEAAAMAFGPVVPHSVLAALNAARPHDCIDARRLGEWRYMQWQNLAALPSWGTRLRWLWQSLSPPTGYLQELYGPERGRVSLLMERGKRAWQRLLS